MNEPVAAAPNKGALTSAESARLAELEPIIEQGIRTFREVGVALAEISDKRLYRATHATFKQYVEEKWKMSVRTAYEQIDHAEVLKALPADCANFAQSANPAQTRELAKVETEKRAEVLKQAAKGGSRVTAKAIRQAAAVAVAPTAGADPGVVVQDNGQKQERISSEAERGLKQLLSAYTAADLPLVRNILRAVLAKTESEDSCCTARGCVEVISRQLQDILDWLKAHAPYMSQSERENLKKITEEFVREAIWFLEKQQEAA